MGTPEEFSENNVISSLSLWLAGQLLGAGYLIFWKARGAVQTPDGWYFDWNSNYASILLDPTFAARWAGGKGLLTLADHTPTEPRFVERPITEAGPIPQHEVLVPALSIEVGPALEIANVELGSRVKWWSRHLVVEGYARNRVELAYLKDKLPIWFKGESTFDIANHDAGSLATVGQVEVLDTIVDYQISRTGIEQATYYIIGNARLEYAA